MFEAMVIDELTELVLICWRLGIQGFQNRGNWK